MKVAIVLAFLAFAAVAVTAKVQIPIEQAKFDLPDCLQSCVTQYSSCATSCSPVDGQCLGACATVLANCEKVCETPKSKTNIHRIAKGGQVPECDELCGQAYSSCTDGCAPDDQNCVLTCSDQSSDCIRSCDVPLVKANIGMPNPGPLNYAKLFSAFKRKYNKVYSSAAMESYRLAQFTQNVQKAAKLNANQKYGEKVHGITKFSDLSPLEFKRQYLTYRPPTGEEALYKKSWPVQKANAKYVNPPTSDWRNKNAVTPVKDQGQCGSCWAHSVVETVESFWFLAGNKLQQLSPQQVNDCDTGDDGCSGGDTVQAYKYLVDTGLETESAYPYVSGGTGQNGNCAYNKDYVVTAPIANFTYATAPCFDACEKQDEGTLATNVAKTGPASICVAADVWQTYTGGVLTSDCSGNSSDLDHCVQLVGLAKQNGKTYWLVRNSWGADWGENGYIYVEYGSNLCGVADEATFVSF